MSVEFMYYLSSSREDISNLSTNERRLWREIYDKSGAAATASLEEFEAYLTASGENINNLIREDKRLWRETFDKSKAIVDAPITPPVGVDKKALKEVIGEVWDEKNAAAEVGVDKEALKEVIGEVWDEKSAAADLTTVVMSEATQLKFDNLLQTLSLNIIQGDIPNFGVHISFKPFDWKGNPKESETPRACTHLETQLTSFGCKFGRGGYKLVDVHLYKTLLNFESPKIGKLSGGTDLAIIPYKTALSGAKLQICVLFELVTDEKASSGMESFSMQGKLELIAAALVSNQRVMLVLTDLVSNCLIYEITPSEEYKGCDLLEYTTTLTEMACFVKEFLTVKAVPDASYIPIPDVEQHVPKLTMNKRLKRNPDMEALQDYLEFDVPDLFERISYEVD